MVSLISSSSNETVLDFSLRTHDVGDTTKKYSYMSGPKEDFNYNYKIERKEHLPILSIDGGGSRIVLPLELAAKLEGELAKETEHENLKLGQVFKVLGGTSAGAIATMILNVRNPAQPEEPLYGAREWNDKFDGIISDIFPHSTIRKIGYYLFNQPKYSRDGLNGFTEDAFKGALIKDALNRFVVPVYPLMNAANPLVINRGLANSEPFSKMRFSQLIASTCAAPTYFKPKRFSNFVFVDGGTYANNPTELTYLEAKKCFGENKNFITCSFGTGMHLSSFDKPNFNPRSVNYGILTWLPIIMDAESNLISKETDKEMRSIYGNYSGYYRWQANIEDNITLDETDPKKLKELRQYADSLIEDNNEMWRRMILDLSHAITAEQLH